MQWVFFKKTCLGCLMMHVINCCFSLSFVETWWQIMTGTVQTAQFQNNFINKIFIENLIEILQNLHGRDFWLFLRAYFHGKFCLVFLVQQVGMKLVGIAIAFKFLSKTFLLLNRQTKCFIEHGKTAPSKYSLSCVWTSLLHLIENSKTLVH